MSWGYVAVAAATVVGGYLGSEGAKKGGESVARAQRDAMSVEERMFQDSLSLQEPYREAGYGAIEGLQGMLDPTVRADALQDYYAGPEYQALSGQASKDIMRARAPTGGLRSGGTKAALAGIAPQLGQKFLSGQQDQMTNLANLGMGAAAQGASGAQQLGGSLGMRLGNIGVAQGQTAQNQANIYGQTIGTLGGLGFDYLSNRGQGGGGNV